MKKNIIFLIIDALIPSRTGFGGNIVNLSPELNQMVNDSFYCNNTYSMGNPTEFALPGLFASSYLLDNGGYAEGIANRKITLAEVLQDEGYHTGAFTPVFRPTSNRYNRGFDDYYNLCDPRVIVKNFTNTANWYYEKNHAKEIGAKECLAALIITCDSYFSDFAKYFRSCQFYADNPVVPKSLFFDHIDYKSYEHEFECEIMKYEKDKIKYISGFLNGEDIGFVNIIANMVAERIKKVALSRADISYRKILLRNLISIWKSNTSYKSAKETIALAVYRMIQGQQQWIKYPSAGFMLEIFKNWIKNLEESKPFYSYLHVMDVHEFNHYSYDLVGMENEKNIELDLLNKVMADIRRDKNYSGNVLYDCSIRYVDHVISSLKLFLEENHILEDTLIVISSDHGGMFHNIPKRGHLAHRVDCFYDELYHIPLIFSGSDISSCKYNGLVSSVDIAPTILDMVGVSIPDSFKGKAVDKEKPGREFVIMENQGRGPCDLQRKPIRICVRTEKLKLVYEVEPVSMSGNQFIAELYDLTLDPDELNNLNNNELIVKQAGPMIKIAQERINDIRK